MPKSLEDIRKALEAITDGGTDFAESLVGILSAKDTDKDSAVDAEKKKGIAKKNEVNKEAEGLRKFKKALTGIGFDPDEHDLDEFTTDITDILQKVKDGGDKGSGGGNGASTPKEVKELQKQMRTMQKTLETRDTELKEANEKTTRLKDRTNRNHMKVSIVDAFKDDKGESKIYAPDLLADSLINQGKIKIDEDDDDGKKIIFVEGDETTDFNEGIEKILETRKDLIRNTQSGGGGSSGSHNRTGKKEETLEERKTRLQRLANPTF